MRILSGDCFKTAWRFRFDPAAMQRELRRRHARTRDAVPVAAEGIR
jgi:hypothetical protein